MLHLGKQTLNCGEVVINLQALNLSDKSEKHGHCAVHIPEAYPQASLLISGAPTVAHQATEPKMAGSASKEVTSAQTAFHDT